MPDPPCDHQPSTLQRTKLLDEGGHVVVAAAEDKLALLNQVRLAHRCAVDTHLPLHRDRVWVAQQEQACFIAPLLLYLLG
ncbi:hypothetical protein [Nonomuraea sp. NPDC049758]|uniref:hypothetical protein n=1 Tax=Nonomuraea sp. NPDC049758 TaxID=3154360 RepID=UPI0034206FBA